MSGRPAPLKLLLRFLDDRSTENYLSNSKNELLNDPTLITCVKSYCPILFNCNVIITYHRSFDAYKFYLYHSSIRLVFGLKDQLETSQCSLC